MFFRRSSEYRAVRLWVGIIVLFLFSMVQSCNELNHSIRGRTATAQITRVEPSTTLRNGVYLTISFKDDTGRDCRVKRSVSGKLGPFVPNQETEVIYLPDTPEKARLVAERSWFWPVVFFGMIGFAVIWSLVTYRRMEAGKF